MTEPAGVEAIDQLRDEWMLKEAEELGRQAVRDFPDDPARWIALGRVRVDQVLQAEALDAFERASRCSDPVPDAAAWQVAVLSRCRRFEEADARAVAGLARWPQNAKIRLAHARVACDQERWAAALPRLDEALAIDPDQCDVAQWKVTTLRNLRRLGEAEETARRAMERHPDAAGLLTSMGWVRFDQIRDEAALDCFRQALKADPRHEWALRSRISLLRRLRRFEEAEAAGREAIELRPRRSSLLVAMAELAKDRKLFEESLGWYELALENAPRHAAALTSRVTVLRLLKRPVEAETAAREAVSLRPDAPGPLVAQGWLAAARHRGEEALDCFSRALAVDPRHAWALRSKVTQLLTSRRVAEAEAAAEEAMGRRPDDASCLRKMGEVKEAQHKLEEALSWYDRALDTSARDLSAFLSRAAVLQRLRRFEEADSAVCEAIERCPNEPDLFVRRGWGHAARYQYESALDWFQRALDLDPGCAWAWRSRAAVLLELRRYERVETVLKEAFGHCPGDPGLLLARGVLEDARFRYAAALDWFERVLDADPGSVAALEWRLVALRRLRRFEEAEAAAEEAVEQHPRDPVLLAQRGWVLHDQSRFDAALRCFEQAVDLDPLDGWVSRSRASMLQRLRRTEEAEAVLRGVLDREPDDVPAMIQMAWSARGRLGLEAALEWYERVLTVDPCHARALELRVTCLRQLRRFDEARAAADAATALRPDVPSLVLERALLLIDEDRFEEALENVRQALEADPLDATALETRVTVLRRLSRYDEAEKAAHEAIERRPDEVDLLVELGLLYDHQLRYEESLLWFDRALRLDAFDVGAINGRSAALRSLRRFDEAERCVSTALKRMPWNRSLREELVWVYHDSHRFDDADQEIARLRADSRNPREEAESVAQAGWVRFSSGDYQTAEERFRAACEKAPNSVGLRFGLAWCLVRQATQQGRDEAEKLCFSVLEQSPRHHSAHTCLGVLNYQRRNYAQAEQHFRRAVELDRHHASYVDLGALYSQLGRFDEAETHLNAALERDWYDAQAHVELGYLHLQRGIDDPTGKPSASAARHFRQARQIDPANGSASLGLAVALMRSAGDFVEGEDVLQQALRRNDCDLPRWQLLMAVAKLLIERGDATQGRQFHADALARAQEAISLASKEAEPYFVAAVARYKLAESAGDFPAKPMQRRKAIRDLRRCVKLDPGNVEARRSLQIMEESLRITRSSTAGSVVVVVVGIAALIALWAAFFLSDKITGVMLTTLTPVLVGLMVVGLVLPFLIRLKLPGGVEADLSASIRQISSGPTGEETFGPGRFSVAAAAASPGPQGQLARL
ncbi:tetratricopeptide repeat protein [Amycolatopsis sp. FU40]|uniref:tetratricopeptide repeat protein n=1 Tax=Amycolatopsis sp. FU40 TaxID=2914159 RepID=UPI001F462A2C|nr:tetratricopeptide repeat protein [Amycolatopsis sp. FU40]UKD56159.1 tetratricopeptide repeat protein [Amycolatopsis sp. FU40]